MAFRQDFMDYERSLRSCFVGNIPYEATEEELKDIFAEVGTVISFRLVFDRDSGKPKGYGFAEFADQETALSAMRNLNARELHGRVLRVDHATNEKNRPPGYTGIGGDEAPLPGPLPPAPENPYGESVTPQDAPEAISKAVASLPPEQMFELMKQMKQCIQNNPVEARNMLLQNPQLAYALLQAQVVMKIVDPEIAMKMLHRQSPVQPPILHDQELERMDTRPNGEPHPFPMDQDRQRGGRGDSPGNRMGPPRLGRGPPGPDRGPPHTMDRGPPQHMERGLPGLGGPPEPMDRGPPRGGPPMDRGPPQDFQRGPPPHGMNRGIGPPDSGPDRGRGPPQEMGRGMPQGMDTKGPGPVGPPQRMDRGPNQRPGMDRGQPPIGGPGGINRPPGRPENRPEDRPRGPEQSPSMDPNMESGMQPGQRNFPPESQRDNRGMRPDKANDPRRNQARPPQPVPVSGSSGPQETQDQEKAALIMQVLQLTPEQIALLPEEQRKSILILKEQIQGGTA